MNKIVLKFCRVCLMSDEEGILADSPSYYEFFKELIGLEDVPQHVWLCVWCKAALKRATQLITLARNSQETLESMKDKGRCDLHTNSTGIYKLSNHCITNIDITSLQDGTIHNFDEMEENTAIIEEELELENFEIKQEDENDSSTSEIDKKDVKTYEKAINYEELQFDVKFLSFEEQSEEVEKRKRSKEKRFSCEVCGEGFVTSDVYEEHSKRHDENAGPYQCAVCRVRFKSKAVLSQHSLAHRRRFLCRLCGATFARWTRCVVHRYQCGTVPSVEVCCHCRKIFSTSLKNSNTKEQQLNEIGNAMCHAYKKALTQHTLQQATAQVFCHNLRNTHSLNVHIKGVHQKEKKHACERCDKRFSDKHRLLVHMRSHTGSRQFSCTWCARAFATRSNLRAHAAAHARGAPARHYCVECDKRYTTRKALNRHLVEGAKHVVADDLIFSCGECKRKFPSQKALESHIKTRHSTKYACLVCNKNFSSNSNLKKHVRCIHAGDCTGGKE